MNRIALVVAAALALSCALTGTPSQAQRADWDQDKVTELASELATVIHDLQQAFRRQPRPTVGSMQSRAHFQMADDLRVLRTETRTLASQLESGAGFEETLPIARRCRTIIRDLRATARRMQMVDPALGLAQRAEEIIAKIGPFYFDPNAS
jgi:hypothetical protein